MPYPKQVASSAHYSDTIAAFRAADEATIVGHLTVASGLTIDGSQIEAWKSEIRLLKSALEHVDGSLFLEFNVPRLGSRLDGVVIAKSAIVPIEFKIGERRFTRHDYDQVWDYALDLKNFHEASRGAQIFPILCATQAPNNVESWGEPHSDGVYSPIRCNASQVAEAVSSAIALSSAGEIDASAWGRASYRPSPTIIEAARVLYARHSVVDIARSDAGARNLHSTSRRVEEIIEHARDKREKAIVFVTGVPGAGKTLVGLNVATQHRADGETHAVFLSGNGPLVSVLSEALVLDEYSRQKAAGGKVRKGQVLQGVKSFIQNVHTFRDEGVRNPAPPAEHVAIFDEAQRAWTQKQTAHFMKRRKGISDFDKSEPQFLLSVMDRHPDWAVIICLVGGGQEIHTGEAGIGAWLDAVREHFSKWKVYISPDLHDSEYAAGKSLELLAGHPSVEQADELHLSVSMRSFRSEQVSRLVKALLESDVDQARAGVRSLGDRYPFVLTRDRKHAKEWLRAQSRGSERYGLVASSQADRLKAYCIDVRVDVDPVKYFLGDREDPRSSFFLEDAATEFQTQGLEMDWTCVCWDADLRRQEDTWSHHSFRATTWNAVRSEQRQRYQLNAYRVLLTRARQGMVIFVPEGRKTDATIRPEYYDGTFEYLRSLGLQEL